jgi:hypothetical protein
MGSLRRAERLSLQELKEHKLIGQMEMESLQKMGFSIELGETSLTPFSRRKPCNPATLRPIDSKSRVCPQDNALSNDRKVIRRNHCEQNLLPIMNSTTFWKI